jgi:hypothetical protein
VEEGTSGIPQDSWASCVARQVYDSLRLFCLPVAPVVVVSVGGSAGSDGGSVAVGSGVVVLVESSSDGWLNGVGV